jgi:peptide/nickel transport system substrate-binding protein
MRRRVRAQAAAGLAAGLLLAAACGGGGDGGDGPSGGEGAAASRAEVLQDPRWERVVDGPRRSDVEPVQGGSLVVAVEGETNSYSPMAFQGSQAGFNVAWTIYDPLVTRDAEGNIRPYLAESVAPNGDFTRWTVRLRPDVRFHDGTTLNAEALRRIFDDHLTAPGALTESASREITGLEVVDDLTVDYVLARANAQFPDLLQLNVGWPFSPDAADRLGADFGSQPVGTGPFRFVRWQRDGELVVERNPDYWQEGQPHLDQITFQPIPDEPTRTASLATGDVDAVQSSRLSSMVADVADIPGVEVVLGPGNGAGGVMFNTAEPPLDDLRLRQALTHAVDQQALIEVAGGEAAALTEPRSQFFPSDSPFYSDEVADASPAHDLDRARRLYEEYVDDPDRSDGRAPGDPVSLRLDSANVSSMTELATAYEGFYEEVGFDVSVEPMDQARTIATAVTGDYQAKLFRMGTNRSPLGELLLYFDDPEAVASNFTQFHDETIASAIERLRTAGDVDEQAAVMEEVGLHLAEQVPWQWTAGDVPFIAAREQLRGLRSWAFPDGTLGDGVTPGIVFWGQVWLDE